MTKDREEFMSKGKYLPEFMRDFHDCKDLFRRIDEIVQNAKLKNPDQDYPNWITAHIYVVDFFLWYMGKCGYTLQRNRSRVEFIDFYADMEAARKRRWEQFSKYLEEMREEDKRMTND